jgi:methyl-accepting chemotaxis protein
MKQLNIDNAHEKGGVFMKWFYTFKVRTKLISACIFMALIAGMIGYFGAGGTLSMNSLKSMIGLIVIGFVAAFGLGLVIARDISVPIAKVIEVLQEMRKGHLGKRLKMDRKDEIGVMANTMDQFADDLQNNVVAVMRKIAAGDLSLKVTPKDSADEIALALKKILDALRGIVAETGQLSTAAAEGKLETRGNTDTFQGGYKDIVQSINNTLDAVIGPLNVAAEYVARIARGDIPAPIMDNYNGDFNEIKQNLNLLIEAMHDITRVAEAIAEGNVKVTVTVRSDQDRLMKALKGMVTVLTEVLQEMESLTQMVQAGKLDARGNVGPLKGSWQALIVGVNNLIEAFVEPITATAEYLDRIAQGDVPGNMTTEYQGEFNTIKHNLNQCIDAISNLMAETSRLTDAAVEGNLSARGDISKFQGDFAWIVQGVNNTLDAVVRPLTVAAEYVDRIAKGDLPEKITDEYKGDFNTIIQNVNILIKAMHDITRMAEAIAEGNVKVTVTVRSDQDRLMNALNGMINALNGVVLVAETIAGGDLMADVKKRSDQDRLMNALKTMITRLNEVMANIKAVADNVASGSQAISSSAEQMSQGATEQAAAAEEVSSSMEQMVANIRQNADNAVQTEHIALKAAEDARKSGDAVTKTVMAIQEIAKKIRLIEEIANETRMLSLNATIEAAKAQDYGKGFAVVAAEVRALAERSRIAATEINDLASNSVTVAEQAGDLLAKLVPDIQKTAELVQEISAASNEQNTGAEQINRAVQQLDSVIQQNTATSEEMAATAEEMASQTEKLQHTIAFFRIAETAWQPLEQGEQNAGAEPLVHEKQEPKGSQKNNGDRKDNTIAVEYAMDVEQRDLTKDDLDAKFERY